jgi:2-desacetyl-2-hydroxyethyl bacteriochlorophyllide A dehydrogenase
MSNMTALVCTRPGELALDRRPEPRPAPGEVLVRIRRIGTCGTDYHIFEGLHPFVEYPRVMGHELSGVVAEAPASSRLRKDQVVAVNPYLSCGDCIACRKGKPNCCVRLSVLGVHRDGGMCEWLSLPEGNLLAADGLSMDDAATIEFLAIGAHAVRRAGSGPGARVLVVGAGPIGLGVALFARIAGAAVTMMDRAPDRIALARAIIGIEDLILAGDQPAEQVAAATGGDGFEVVIDATGNRASMEQGFGYVSHGGHYVLVSVVKDDVTFSDAEFHKREMTLRGCRNATAEDFDRVIGAIRAGQVPVARLITHRTTLAAAAEDLPRWVREKHGLVKALIEID